MPILESMLLATSLTTAPVPSGPGETATLRYRADRTWDVQLPAERFIPVSGGFPIAHAGGAQFVAEVDGTTLVVDTDGDGVTDRRIEATTDDSGARHARVTLRGTTTDGADLRYAVRLREENGAWTWAAGGAMHGRVGTTPVRLYDQNHNGRYDDYGVDAMIVGRGTVASYLSRAIVTDGTLLELDVAPDGTTVTTRPFSRETGTLDVTTGLRTDAKLLAAIVRSADGAYAFDLAATPGPVTVPAASYEIMTGALGLGRQRVEVTAGRAEAIDVTPGASTTLTWGGPVDAEFEYERAGEQVVFSPDHIWYYGAAGEQYSNWDPIGKSPTFTVRNAVTKEVLEVVILPGST